MMRRSRHRCSIQLVRWRHCRSMQYLTAAALDGALICIKYVRPKSANRPSVQVCSHSLLACIVIAGHEARSAP